MTAKLSLFTAALSLMKAWQRTSVLTNSSLEPGLRADPADVKAAAKAVGA